MRRPEVHVGTEGGGGVIVIFSHPVLKMTMFSKKKLTRIKVLAMH